MSTSNRRGFDVVCPLGDISDIAKDVEARFDTSNYELNRPLAKKKNQKEIGLWKDKLRGKIMNEFTALRAKTYSYLTDNNGGDKKAKFTKKCVRKIKLKFKDYKKCLKSTQLENEINQLERKKG